MFQLKRVGEKPILSPRREIPWEKDAVLNAAAHYEDDKFHLWYRAVAHNPGDPNRSSIGYAASNDGIHFERRMDPVLCSNVVPEESQGVEDPRVTRIDDSYYMFYTAYDGAHCQIAMAESKDRLKWQRRGVVISQQLFGFNKDAALFPEKINGRYCLMHRPVPDIYLSFSDNLLDWTDHVCIMQPRAEWEAAKIGGGAQPIKTEKGWLLVYHGVDSKKEYCLGLALLDPADPRRVIKRLDYPILRPEAEWELTGDVANVVFSCGAVLLGTELWVYYGGADTVIGLAKGNISQFLAEI